MRFSLPGAGRPVEVTADWFLRHARGPVYCVGRERTPPLAGAKDEPAGLRFPVLARHRVVLMAADEVPEVVATLLATATE